MKELTRIIERAFDDGFREGNLPPRSGKPNAGRKPGPRREDDPEQLRQSDRLT